MKKTVIAILLFVCSFPAYCGDKRQMRAAWIATVANIDWPSPQAVGNTELQQEQLISILDSLTRLHFNTVVFQVRPTADAFYWSELEPLSSWLTGKQGQNNDIAYDPLEFLLTQAHKRCLDVHVWLNPYRVTHTFSEADLDSIHIFRQHPEWFWEYGDKWYFNPGLDQTRQWLNQVVADIVSRYDIDGIHFDDYFYPYKVRDKRGQFLDFPDAQTFAQYPRGFTDKDEWRRNNVNMVIEELQHTIKSLKPWVEFGISPFGVWRNQSSDPRRGSRTQAGVQNYDDLYADILLWLEKGWIDYVAPQLYWEIGKTVADYETLAHWWVENSYGKNLYIGHYVSQLENRRASASWLHPNEICRQLRLNSTIDGIDGSVMYSTAPMLRNPQGITDSLRNTFFRYYALPPINRNINSNCNLLPPDNLQLNGHTLTWENRQEGRYYVIYGFPIGETIDFDNAQNIIGLTSDTTFELDEPDRYQAICITSVDRYKQESLPCILER